MFSLLNKRSSQNDISSIELYSDDLNEVISMSLEFSKKHQAAIILLCGSIIENYDAFLNNLALQMYNRGMIDNQTVERRGLLQILSGDLPVDAVVREIAGTSNVNKKLRYISSFHQMKYDMHNSASLLNHLQSLMLNGQVLSPIVLNIPTGACQTIKDICPELWNHSIRYMKESGDSIHDYQYRPIINAARAESGYPKDSIVGYDVGKKRDALQSGHSTVVQEKREREEMELPWYKKNLELFKTEKDGMTMHLKNYSYSQIDMVALPRSKRLNWKFVLRLRIKDMSYDLQLRIVYPETFSENHLDVGVVIENANEKLMRAISCNRLCKQTIYNDPEFDRIFIIKRVYKGNNESSAAAALEGLVDLLKSFN